MGQDSFNFLCFVIFITNVIWMIWNICLHRDLDKLKKKYTEQGSELSHELLYIKSELRHIYRQSNILPYEEMKRLDGFFGNGNYNVNFSTHSKKDKKESNR